jgi:hypothetical protein
VKLVSISPGVDVIYDHNFLRFFPIFAEKIGVILKYQCYDQLFSEFSFVSSQKRQFFRKIFWRKYLKNHNIGPSELRRQRCKF